MEKAEGAPVQSMSPDAEGSDKGQFDLGANLYSPDPAERLQAARSLSPEERKKAVARLRRGCPVRGWPYGMPTVVNPWIVVIGASPGGSPAKDDKWASGSYPAPTVGAAHLGIYYQDGRDYWGKVRELAGSALASQRMRASADQGAMTGALNFDDGRSGTASAVPLRHDLVDWVVSTVLNRLRPMVIVTLGLRGMWQNDEVIRDVLAKRAPQWLDRSSFQVQPLETTQNQSLSFLVNRSDSGPVLVHWPQHPSRAPFTSRPQWQASCREFGRHLPVWLGQEPSRSPRRGTPRPSA